ncbi:hypothetical protein BDB00DRAFT_562903 [Zychaea mexicana]|uniref:uncharacterized protein n=1 Tax=Zychaea mexicana TaxID=64656 RepID=UPI0022FEFC84|nr:uncharacterized protein BDB00DRAFT_562903 [Zychaea mexicana]KAI9490224.1 hypothetical protein BDB00DRAFT_562903 [Zychaea mexicana]
MSAEAVAATTTTITEQLIGGIAYLTSLEYQEIPVLDVLHAFLIAYAYRSAVGAGHNQIGWGQGLLAVIIMCAGGGSTVAILRGEPLGILKSNAFWGIYGLAYWSMFSNSFVYPLFNLIFSLPFVEEAFTVADAILRNAAIVNFGVLGVNSTLGEDKYIAKILCGTLAGSGGGFWIDTFNLTHHNWSFSTPRWLHAATMDVKASFATALFYILATNPTFAELTGGWKVFTATEAEAWSAVVLSVGLIYGGVSARWQRKRSNDATKERKTQ